MSVLHPRDGIGKSRKRREADRCPLVWVVVAFFLVGSVVKCNSGADQGSGLGLCAWDTVHKTSVRRVDLGRFDNGMMDGPRKVECQTVCVFKSLISPLMNALRGS